MPTDWPLRRPKPQTMLLAQMREVLEELAVVDDLADDLLHVVGLVRAGRQDLAQRGAQAVGVVSRSRRAAAPRGCSEGRKPSRKRTSSRHDFSSGETKVATPDLRGVAHGPAELLERHLFAGDRLDHVGTGDEHVRLLPDHEDEVGHGRRVDGAARARPEDHADLGHHAGRQHVAVEDAAVAGQGDDAFLDAGAGAVVQADHRRAHLERQVHQLVDLLGEHLTQRATEHREVLAEDEHLATVDRAPAGDDAVGVRPLFQAGGVGAVAGQQVELLERAGVEQVVDALAGEHLALGVLALDGTGRAGVVGLIPPAAQLLELVLHRIGHGGRRYFRPHRRSEARPARPPDVHVRRSGTRRSPART